MAQDFSLRHHIFGGQTESNLPARWRQRCGDASTEIRLSKIAREMLGGIDKDCVDFSPTMTALAPLIAAKPHFLTLRQRWFIQHCRRATTSPHSRRSGDGCVLHMLRRRNAASAVDGNRCAPTTRHCCQRQRLKDNYPHRPWPCGHARQIILARSIDKASASPSSWTSYPPSSEQNLARAAGGGSRKKIEDQPHPRRVRQVGRLRGHLNSSAVPPCLSSAEQPIQTKPSCRTALVSTLFGLD